MMIHRVEINLQIQSHKKIPEKDIYECIAMQHGASFPMLGSCYNYTHLQQFP